VTACESFSYAIYFKQHLAKAVCAWHVIYKRKPHDYILSCSSAPLTADHPASAGLLLLNRSVYSGAHIMTCPQDVPEQCFPLQAQPQSDTLLDLRPLQQQLAACSSSSSSAVSACGPGAVLTPDLHKLYSLLEETQRTLPGRSQQAQQQDASAGADVAGIMQQALRKWRCMGGSWCLCSPPAGVGVLQRQTQAMCVGTL
jgi:hypothetical protein